MGLQVNIKKYKFRVKHIKYFRFIISLKGIKVNSKKVKAISNWKPLYIVGDGVLTV